MGVLIPIRPPGAPPVRLLIPVRPPSVMPAASSRLVRNLPTLALFVGLAAIGLLIRRLDDATAAISKSATWENANSPRTQPSSGDPAPEWWPTGSTSSNPAIPSRVTVSATGYEYVYDEGLEDYVPVAFPVAFTSDVLVPNGAAISVEASPTLEGQPPVDGGGKTYRWWYSTSVSERHLIGTITGTASNPVNSPRTSIAPSSGGGVGVPYTDFAPDVQRPNRNPGQFVPTPSPATPSTPRRLVPGTRPGPGLIPSSPPVPLPAPAPLPLDVPIGDPAFVPAPAVPRLPVIRPRPGPSPLPVPAPNPRPINPDGTPAPIIEPQPDSVPDWQEIPWEGADPIGDPAQRPRPDLDSIAREMGRQEQKLSQIGGMLKGLDKEPSWLDDIVSELVREIVDKIKQNPPASTSCPLNELVDPVKHVYSPPYDVAGVGKAREAEYAYPQQTMAWRLVRLVETVIFGQGVISEWRVKLSKGNAPSANVTLTGYGSPDE